MLKQLFKTYIFKKTCSIMSWIMQYCCSVYLLLEVIFKGFCEERGPQRP